MTVTSWDIDQLARVLYDSGDKVFNGCSKLSINALLLHQIDRELNTRTLPEYNSENANFQVLSTQHYRSDKLQFIHDFFQKTSGLKIVNHANLLGSRDNVDISKFKKLKYLELKRVPIKQLIGLKVIQHQMECIVCERGLTTLEHLLAECGGDNSTGFVWSELKEAVLSFNDIRVVDSSVAFAPWLQVLDLSHNQIFDVNAIERLPNLKYVNLSFNSLTNIPVFNKSAKKKLEVLIVKNNHIESLDELAGLDCLRELDMSNNFLCCAKSFKHLLTMSTLQWLSLRGNPVCVSKKYRWNVIRYLHISASFGSFVLDEQMLSKKEKENVGLELSSNIDENPVKTLPIPNVDIQPGPSHVHVQSDNKKSRKKCGKVRLAAIPNIDGTYDIVLPETDVPTLKSAPTSLHLETKKIIENARATHGDNWLRAQAAEVVTDVLGLPHTALSSTPYDDSCLAAFLENPSLTSTNEEALSQGETIAATTGPLPQNLHTTVPGAESFLSCNDTGSNYYSIKESPPTELFSNSKEISPDIETIVDSEEEIAGHKENVYLAVRIIRDGSEIRREELFLTLTLNELKERDVVHGRTIGNWSLSCLDGVTLVRECELLLTYNTIRRERRERHYEFQDATEFQEFFDACRAAYEACLLSRKRPYKCVVCSHHFSADKKLENQGEGARCPACGSKVVVVVVEDSGGGGGGAPVRRLSVTPTSEGGSGVRSSRSHIRSTSMGGVATGFHPHVSRCPSGSSLGSSSDDQRSQQRGPCVMKSDSDIEIISNPSQSSIEIIDVPPTNDTQKSANDGLLTLPSLTATLYSGLTESSSSGSITDSICTAYENNNSMMNSNISKMSVSGIAPLLEEPADTTVKPRSLVENEFQILLKDVIERTEEKVPKYHRRVDKDVDQIEYSFTKFNELDHRIKLYIYAHLLENANEEIRFLLRCQIMCNNDEAGYDACLVFSDCKMYTLMIIGKEEGEEASKFLQKMDNLTVPLTDFRHWRTLAWNQGFLITYRSGYDKLCQFIAILKDPTKTLNFYTFTVQYENMFPKCDWSKSADHEGSLAVTQFLLSIGHECLVTCFHGFSLCRVGENGHIKLLQDGAIFITNTYLYIIESLKWMLPAAKRIFPPPSSTQKISDLILTSVGDKELKLQFLDESAGQQQIWHIVFSSQSIVDSILLEIRNPWEQLFSVPLEVNIIDDD